MKSTNLPLAFLAIAIILQGCSFQPRKLKIFYKSPEIIKIIPSEEEILEVGYMSRYLLDQDEREPLEDKVAKFKDLPAPIKISSGFDYGDPFDESIAETVLIPFEQRFQKAMFMSAVGMLLYLTEDEMEGIEQVSKIYLPESDLYQTAEEAKEFARKYSINKITEFAKKENRSIRKILTNENALIFQLIKQGKTGDEFYEVNKPNEVLDDDYFDPPSLFVFLVHTPIIEADDDPIRDNILGFKAAWESHTSNGWVITLTGRIIIDGVDFTSEMLPLSDGGKHFQVYFSAEANPLSRRFFRAIMNEDNYIFRGTNVRHAKQVEMKGKVYGFKRVRTNRFIEYEIDKRTDIDNKKE
jgi:hypothetical protein